MKLPLPPLPDRIARLPQDRRGFPIPWNVLRGVDDSPVFTVNDDRKHKIALRRGLCPICGEALGRWKWFIGGPRSAFDPNGWYLDLPGHQDCMQFALAVCPYLAAPRYLGRIDVANPEILPVEARVLLDETVMPERPEIFVAVASRLVQVQERGLLAPYVRPMRPALAYQFWRHGEEIPKHRAMPILRGIFGVEWTVPDVEAE